MANSFRWTFYLDSHDNWRWKRKASASQGVTYSEGFRNKTDCIDNARSCGYVVDEKAAPLSGDPFSDVRRPETE